MTATTHVNEYKAQFTKKRAFNGMVFLLSIANCAVKIAFEGATQTSSHVVGLVHCQPLKKFAILLTPSVSCSQHRDRRARRRSRGARLWFTTYYCELIHESSIGHVGVD